MLKDVFMKLVCVLILVCVATGCARTVKYDGHRWEAVKQYEGDELPMEELAVVMVRQPLHVVSIRQKDVEEEDAIEIDEIAERDIMLELLPEDYLITVGYREHNVMNETVRKGFGVTLKYEAKVNHIYRAVLLKEVDLELAEKFEQELDEEFEWAVGIQDVISEEVVTVPVMLRHKAKSVAQKTQEKLSKTGSRLNLRMVTNKAGRVEFIVPKK